MYWYDECGLLAFERHSEIQAVDASDPTNIIVLASDTCQELVGLDIATPACNTARHFHGPFSFAGKLLTQVLALGVGH